MMFSKVTGRDLNTTDAVKPAVNGQSGVGSALMGLFKNRQPNKTNTATNTTTTNTTVAKTHAKPQPKEMDFVDEVAAGRLLEHAKTFIRLSRRGTTPKKGIEMCRDIFAKYPNTKYSEQARMLLREVPERYRKRYKVTDEELGL
jgi:hypothetical protein